MFVGLLILFGWCTVWSAYELTRPQSVRQRISNALHLAMSLVMLLMVAGPTWTTLTGLIPTAALAGLFALAIGWFAWLAVAAGRASDRDGLVHFVGHAAMFAAMTWHLAAMAVMTAGMTGGHSTGTSGHDHGGHDHSGGGMEMGDWMTVQSQPGGVLWWFALIGLPLMAYLLGASLRSLWLAAQPASPAGSSTTEDDHTHPVAVPSAHSHSCHELRPQGSAKYRLAALSDFAMTAGMFWMSTGLLAPVLPFFALLAF